MQRLVYKWRRTCPKIGPKVWIMKWQKFVLHCYAWRAFPRQKSRRRSGTSAAAVSRTRQPGRQHWATSIRWSSALSGSISQACPVPFGPRICSLIHWPTLVFSGDLWTIQWIPITADGKHLYLRGGVLMFFDGPGNRWTRCSPMSLVCFAFIDLKVFQWHPMKIN